MLIIARFFNSLVEYVEFIYQHGSKPFRPSKCGYCGKAGLRCHGFRERKADRENHCEDSLNPVLIPRFFCKHCRRTCSVLPNCISPRRWYLWSVQQLVLSLDILEHSLRYIASKTPPVRSTIARWELRLRTMFPIHSLHLKSRAPDLGRSAESFCIFWKACLAQMSLSDAMFWIYCAGEVIP